jgi:catecholate siderophore receptor
MGTTFKVNKGLRRRARVSAMALTNAILMAGAAQAQTAAEPEAAPKPETADEAAKKKATADKLKKPVINEGVSGGTMDEVVVRAQGEDGYKADKMSSDKYTLPLRDTPQTINVIPEKVMKDQNATSLRDVIRNVPGISFQAGEGGVPAGDNMSIRGFSARTDMYVDGVRDIGGYTRDPFNLQQVEVTKGPNSAYSGRGSTGGTINMSTKAPHLDNRYGGDVGIGTDQYYRVTTDINQVVPLTLLGSDNPAAFRLNGLFHSQDFANRDYVSNQRWGVAPTITFGLNTDTRLTFNYLHLQEDNLASYGIPFLTSSAAVADFGPNAKLGRPAPVPNKTFYGLLDRDYEDITNDVGGMHIEHDFTDNVQFESITRAGRTFRDSIITAPRVNTAGAGSMNRQFQSRYQTDDIFVQAFNLKTKFETGPVRHEMVSSIEYDYETETNKLRAGAGAANGDLFNPNPNDPAGTWDFTGAKNVAFSNSVGVSVFDSIHLTDQWILSLGVRQDWFETTYEQTGADPGNVRTDFYRADCQPTWRTGVTFKPVPYGSIFFGYGTSINPSAEGLTLADGPTSTNSTNLEPEQSESFELGTKWDLLQERLSLTAALFRTNKNNYKNVDPITGVIDTSGEVRVQGIEVGVAGQITNEWSVFAGYAIMESEIVDSDAVFTYNGVAGIPEEGRDLPNTPEQTASLWTTYKLPFNFEVGTGFSFVDKRYANSINTNSVPGYWLQDAMVSYRVNDHWRVQLNISNLWDEEYIDRVGGGHVIPGVGRAFVLSSSLSF